MTTWVVNLLARSLRYFKLATSSNTNHVFCIVLESVSSLRIKTKAPQVIQCNYGNDSFKIILNDSFLTYWITKKILKLGLNLFTTSMHFFQRYCFFLLIFKNYIPNYQWIFVHFYFVAAMYWTYMGCIYVV